MYRKYYCFCPMKLESQRLGTQAAKVLAHKHSNVSCSLFARGNERKAAGRPASVPVSHARISGATTPSKTKERKGKFNCKGATELGLVSSEL